MEKYLYHQVNKTLKLQILNGIFKEGELLPSEHELCRQYHLARSTVRQALKDLETEGYILRRKGKGSIVINRRHQLGLFTIKGFTHEVSELHENVHSEILEGPEKTPWPADFFCSLTETEKQAGCIVISRLRYVSHHPVMFEKTYLPDIQIPDFCRHPLFNDSLFDTLRYYYSIEIKTVSQEMRAVRAGAAEAAMMKIQEGSPLLQVFLKYRTSRKDFHIYSALLCNTEKYSIGNLT